MTVGASNGVPMTGWIAACLRHTSLMHHKPILDPFMGVSLMELAISEIKAVKQTKGNMEGHLQKV